MRKINVFKVSKGRIEYTERIKAAVLDPRITGLELHLNGGYDWIDSKYGFVKLLIARGQVKTLHTYSDLLARTDYMDAMIAGRSLAYVNFDYMEKNTLKGSFASLARVEVARARFSAYLKQVEVAS